MQTRRRLSLSAALLYSLVWLGPAAGPSAAKVLTLPVPQWSAIGAEADRALKAGSWELGRDAAERLIGQILTQPVEGQGLDTVLARAVAYRAIALAGLGDAKGAEWAAATARELGFTPRDLDLSAYGTAGEVMRAALQPASARENPDLKQVGKGVGRPEFVDRTAPAYPDVLRGANVGGVVIVSATIGEDGRMSAPQIQHSPSIYLSLAALDSLRTWRFKPATYAGKPVAVSYVLTVNFAVEAKPKP